MKDIFTIKINPNSYEIYIFWLDLDPQKTCVFWLDRKLDRLLTSEQGRRRRPALAADGVARAADRRRRRAARPALDLGVVALDGGGELGAGRSGRQGVQLRQQGKGEDEGHFHWVTVTSILPESQAPDAKHVLICL